MKTAIIAQLAGLIVVGGLVALGGGWANAGWFALGYVPTGAASVWFSRNLD